MAGLTPGYWNDSEDPRAVPGVNTFRRTLRLLDEWTLSAFNPRPFNLRHPGHRTGQ